jgi:PAS domain-containing protein
MAVKKNFLDRFSERLEDLDVNSRQAYILRLARERGFFETVFNAVEEGILVLDEQLRIRYFNRAAKDLLALPDDMENVRIFNEIALKCCSSPSRHAYKSAGELKADLAAKFPGMVSAGQTQ